MTATISSVAELEACIGAAGLPVKMKIIDHLDATARAWIAAAPVAFVAVGSDTGPRVAAAGGAAGFVAARGPEALAVPRAALDETLGPVEAGRGAGVLFLAPGVGETLRANGRVAAVDGEVVEIAVEECFVHCAKALIRSAFWAGGRGEGEGAGTAPDDAAGFLNAARFLALATMDAEGRIDISPKGDPAGLLIRLDANGRAALAERPGNRLAFGYRNMIAQPKVAGLGLIPGVERVVLFEGEAHLTADEGLRAGFVVEGKTPVLATVIEGVAPRLARSGALSRARLWDGAAAAGPAIDPATTLMAHLKLNKARGATATLLRLAANRGLIESGLKSNYRTQLY